MQKNCYLIGEKILENVFQSNCSSKLRTNLRKIEKRPKIRHRLVTFSGLQLLLINPIHFMLRCYLIIQFGITQFQRFAWL